jgi:hypothetical protein
MGSMAKQGSFAGSGFEKYGRKTRRERFLEEMNAAVPWQALIGGHQVGARRAPRGGRVFEPEYAPQVDAFVICDMPGIRFTGQGPQFVEPTPRFKENLFALTKPGKGFGFLHHTIAGWPAWPEYDYAS